jgi:hypothetical protein
VAAAGQDSGINEATGRVGQRPFDPRVHAAGGHVMEGTLAKIEALRRLSVLGVVLATVAGPLAACGDNDTTAEKTGEATDTGTTGTTGTTGNTTGTATGTTTDTSTGATGSTTTGTTGTGTESTGQTSGTSTTTTTTQ